MHPGKHGVNVRFSVVGKFNTCVMWNAQEYVKQINMPVNIVVLMLQWCCKNVMEISKHFNVTNETDNCKKKKKPKKKNPPAKK